MNSSPGFVACEIRRSMVSVGNVRGRGRGFVIKPSGLIWDRLIVTALHCLEDRDRPEAALIGPLDGDVCLVAECLWLSPQSDVAILMPPRGDDPLVTEQQERFEQFISEFEPLTIREPSQRESVWLPGLDGGLIHNLAHCGKRLYLRDGGLIKPGMSGSPIISADDGAAIGLVCRSGGANPLLCNTLPDWLLSIIDK